MEILVRTDHPIPEDDALTSSVGFELLAGLGPCAARVVKAQVNLTTEADCWGGPVVLHCRLEVLPCGHAPLAVMHRGTTDDEAVRGAVVDMRGVLERMFRRIDAHRTAETVSPFGATATTEGGEPWTSRFGPTTTSQVTRA
ncbi:MAG TPA: hypothetical protein VHO29_17590 [Marmoricola sp.]|nr:hypothetical protein [Marmoricola sp.]